MIITLILQFFVSALNVVFTWLGHVSTLPFGMDAALLSLMGSWYAFMNIFWPLQIVWTLYIWYMGIALTLWGLRLVRVLK